jgi:chemotaxis response regulator CheB
MESRGKKTENRVFPIVGIGDSAGGLEAFEKFLRIMSYRTHENVIDGVVITFADITALKQLEISLRENDERLKVLLSRDDPGVRT